MYVCCMCNACCTYIHTYIHSYIKWVQIFMLCYHNYNYYIFMLTENGGRDYYYDYYDDWRAWPTPQPRVSVLKNTNIEAEMSARRQVEGRRVHYSKEDPEMEHYHRYQSPSPGPRHRQQLHPGDSRVHRQLEIQHMVSDNDDYYDCYDKHMMIIIQIRLYNINE